MDSLEREDARRACRGRATPRRFLPHDLPRLDRFLEFAWRETLLLGDSQPTLSRVLPFLSCPAEAIIRQRLRERQVVLIGESLAPRALEGLQSLRSAQVLKFHLERLLGRLHDLIAELPPAFHAPIRHPPQRGAARGVDIAPDLLPFLLDGGAGKYKSPA